MRFARLLLLTATLGVAIGEGAVAQQGPATVSGRLVDPNGNAVTGLERTSLALTNVETGESLEGPISQQTGEFTVNGVRPGTYDIKAAIICCLYSSVDQKGVRIEPGQRIDVPVQWGMNLGTIGDDPGILGNDMRAHTALQPVWVLSPNMAPNFASPVS
jgi:hypothetical protein